MTVNNRNKKGDLVFLNILSRDHFFHKCFLHTFKHFPLDLSFHIPRTLNVNISVNVVVGAVFLHSVSIVHIKSVHTPVQILR